MAALFYFVLHAVPQQHSILLPDVCLRYVTIIYLVCFHPRRRAATNARRWRGSTGSADHGAPTRGQLRANFTLRAVVFVAKDDGKGCKTWAFFVHIRFMVVENSLRPIYYSNITVLRVVGDRHSSVSPNRWRRCVFRLRYPHRTSRKLSGCSKFQLWLPPLQARPRGIWDPFDRRLNRKCGEQRTS